MANEYSYKSGGDNTEKGRPEIQLDNPLSYSNTSSNDPTAKLNEIGEMTKKYKSLLNHDHDNTLKSH